MNTEDIQERIDQLSAALVAMRPCWSFLLQEMKNRADEMTAQLINQDNEQTRGRIKALHELMELPEALQAERDGMSAALSDMDAAL